jgi:hypothetical protein
MAVLASDDFNRTDAATLGTGWSEITFGIVSNHAKINTSSDDGYAYYSGATWPDDQYSEATLGTTTASGEGTVPRHRQCERMALRPAQQQQFYVTWGRNFNDIHGRGCNPAGGSD